MGNSISKQTAIKDNYIAQIKNYECPTLNIGKRVGMNGYIDFIKSNEIEYGVNVVKGYDLGSRFFIAVKCEFVYIDGRTERTFSVFFQRYNDCKHLWHCSGCDEIPLMDTEGGMLLEQFHFLCELLQEGEITLNQDTTYNTYLSCFPNGLSDYLHESTYPIILKLGYSD